MSLEEHPDWKKTMSLAQPLTKEQAQTLVKLIRDADLILSTCERMAIRALIAIAEQ